MKLPRIHGGISFPALALAAALFQTSAAHAQTYLYWIDTNYASPRMGRANPDGTSPTTVPLAANTLPEGLALDLGNGILYWTESAWTGANVNRMDPNLANPAAVVAGESALHGIAIDAAHSTMYWTSTNLDSGAAIERSDVNGNGHFVIEKLGAGANPRGIAIDAANSRVIWADYDAGTILTCGLLGGAITPLATLSTGVWGVALDPTSTALLVTNYVAGTIQKSLPPYPSFSPIYTGLSNPTYVAANPTSGAIYWSEAGAGAQKIQRGDEIGSTAVNLSLGVTSFGGLAIGNPASAGVLPSDAQAITEFALEPPAPNPARTSTRIAFALPSEAHVRLQVLDVAGREVARLVDADFAPGRYTEDWNLEAARTRPAAGIYFVRLEAAGRLFTRRLALVR